MKVLQIDVFDGPGNFQHRMHCKHMDSVKSFTAFNEVYSVSKEKNPAPRESAKAIQQYVLIPEEIDHFIIEQGLITIYYTCGWFIEVSKVPVTIPQNIKELSYKRGVN